MTFHFRHKWGNTKMFTCTKDDTDRTIEQQCKCGKKRWYHQLSGFFFYVKPKWVNRCIKTDISESSGFKLTTEQKINALNNLANG